MALSSDLGFIHGPFQRPSVAPKSLHESGICQADDRCPFGYCVRLTSIRVFDVLSSVIGLLARRGPAAIARFVVAFIVNSIQRMQRRTWPHVGVELREVLAPSWMHRNAASAITRIFGVVRVVTTRFSAFPLTMFACACAPMRQMHLDQAVARQTPATLRMTGAQFIAGRDDDRAAYAATFPQRIVAFDVRALKDSQSLEAKAVKVGGKSWHLYDYTAYGRIR